MLKSLVIAALALINIFFLVVIGFDTVNDARTKRQAIENVCAVLQKGGIAIDPDNVKSGGEIKTMKTSRGDETEAAIAHAVLGPTVMTDQGVIYQYFSETRGVAEFSSAGDFEIRLNEGAITETNGALRTVQGILRDMKLEASGINVYGEPGNETVTAVSAYKGVSIYNCTIEFKFQGGNLLTVKGRYITGITPAGEDTVISQAGTALLGFYAAVRDESREDIACTSISSVEAGYQYRVVGTFGEGLISPVWLFVTDTGQYIFDDATGEVRMLP